MLVTEIPVDDNITLSLPNSNDTPALWQLIQNNQHYLSRWLSWPKDINGQQDTAALILKVRERCKHERALILLVRYQDQLCGVVAFNSILKHNHSATIGYWIGEKFQGRGIISKSVQRLIQLAFEQYGLNKVIIGTGLGNEASEAIPHRLGFVLDGISRANEMINGQYIDHKIFSLLKAEWLRHRKQEFNDSNDD